MFLIDGYNLLHALTRGRASESAREQLLSKTVEYCAQGNYRAWIIFDATGGMKRREQRGPVEIYNVPQGQTADEVILNALATCDDQMQYTVVSNDLKIIKAAEKDGYKVLPCEEFGRRILARPEAPEKGGLPSPGEVDYWMKEFGFDEDVPP
ncbi:MAG TPA: NYN domain-containing protein [Planctomycetota bacterium]|nr:NYN domain-containing protein [Planctomycetota bacterium]